MSRLGGDDGVEPSPPAKQAPGIPCVVKDRGRGGSKEPSQGRNRDNGKQEAENWRVLVMDENLAGIMAQWWYPREGGKH